MPIYEYECGSCNAHYEVFQKITARPLRKCEKCGGPLHKLISQSTFHLKGSGWYVTDYAGKKAPTTKEPKAKESKTKEQKAKKSGSKSKS